MKLLSLNKPLKILLFTNALIRISAAMLAPIYALFVKKIGGDLIDASLGGGIYALVAGLMTIISGRFSDKVKENELILVLGYSIMGIGFLLYFWINSIIFLFIVQAIIAIGEALYLPVFDALYTKHIDKNKTGSQWGLRESMNYFVIALGAIIGGGLASFFGFQTMFILMAFLCFVSAFYIYSLKRSVL